MVKVNRRGGRGAAGSCLTFVIAGLLLVIALLLLTVYQNAILDVSVASTTTGSAQQLLQHQINQALSVMTTSTLLLSDDDDNANQVKAWRKHIRDTCRAATTAEQVTAMTTSNKQGLVLPNNNIVPQQQPRGDTAVKRCQRVVMDFGANIGDTSGHVIDAGLLPCDRTQDLQTSTPQVHFNVSSKQLEDTPRRNPLTQNLLQLMKTQGALVGPEDYCYYGVEGNPVFTDRLRGIEDFVMAIRPRPIQHMHFFTEHVGAGQDGMTKLYLDTINKDVNFWGSSLFKDHQDVRKSNANSTETVAADVMGRTIGSLMRQTLRAYDPAASAADKTGNHLVLKVDIEGGEYPLLFEAAEEGTLCDFVKAGNTADLYIEFHSQRVTGTHGYAGRVAGMKEKLTKCGVAFRNLQAWWA
jgi:hypothetical protein